MKQPNSKYTMMWLVFLILVCAIEYLISPLTNMIDWTQGIISKDDGSRAEFTVLVIGLVIMRIIAYAIPLSIITGVAYKKIPDCGSILKSIMLAIVIFNCPILAINLSRYIGPDWLSNVAFLIITFFPMFLFSLLKADKESVISVFVLTLIFQVSTHPILIQELFTMIEYLDLLKITTLLTLPTLAAYLLRRFLDIRKSHCLA